MKNFNFISQTVEEFLLQRYFSSLRFVSLSPSGLVGVKELCDLPQYIKIKRYKS